MTQLFTTTDDWNAKRQRTQNGNDSDELNRLWLGSRDDTTHRRRSLNSFKFLWQWLKLKKGTMTILKMTVNFVT